jgi:hypothetical protein
VDVTAMIGAPRDPAWVVWADQLQALGDSRGELIALELLPESERSPEQVERLRVLYQPHIERFEGHHRALLPGGWLTREVRCWRFGYVVELSLADLLPVPEPSSYSALFGADELRCLTSLHISLAQAQVEPFLDALERHRPPLTELGFLGHQDKANFDERACERLWAALPALQTLSFSPFTQFAHINHSGLTAISLLPGRAGMPVGLELVAGSELPALVRLENHALWDLDRLDDPLWQGQRVMSLLERLEVFEYPHMFFFDDATPETWPWLDAASRLPSSTTIVAFAVPQLASAIREHLPNVKFEFSEARAYELPLSRRRRKSSQHEYSTLTVGWPCGQPSLEMMHLRVTVLWTWVEMDAEQRRGAWDLIAALDASERGQPIEFEREVLQRMLQSWPLSSESALRFAPIIAALEQHRACCPEVVLMIESRTSTAPVRAS